MSKSAVGVSVASQGFRAGIWRAPVAEGGFNVWTYAVTETGHHNCLHLLARNVRKPVAERIMRQHNRSL